MAIFLSMIQNQKADPGQNIHPDENYAREVLQLFSIGLNWLNSDGTPMLSNGQPIPTYNQAVVRGFAAVFTGWDWDSTGCGDTSGYCCDEDTYFYCGPDNQDDVRWRKPMLPVLILSARSEVDTKLRGFELGADDYLAKPFSLDELLARVRARLRSRQHASGDAYILHAGRLLLDVAKREARLGSRVSELTDGEFRLLRVMLERAGDVVSREQLLADVWGYDFDPRSNVVDVSIRRLRRKLGPDAPIETVRNVGYRLAAG